MFTSPHIRRLILVLALPLMSVTSIANADDSERDQIIAAIESVKANIEITAQRIADITEEIPKIQKDIEEYDKMYRETKKDEYRKAYEEAVTKLDAKMHSLVTLENRINDYRRLLQDLEARLAALGG